MFFKSNQLENTFKFILLLAILSACNVPADKKTATVKEDSLDYYPPTPAQIDKSEFRYYYKKLSHFFKTTLLSSNAFNGGILVAKNGAVLYEKYSGLVDFRRKDADSVNASTPFHVASTSKPLTAIAILKMVQENKLSLDDSLSKFFPGLPYPGITVKMLLDHRSGLPNYVYFVSNSDWDKTKNVTNADVLNLLYTLQPKKSYPAGTHFSYSNTNYILLALIIEKISGETFPEYMKKNIFDPLQMTNTFIFTPADSLRVIPSFYYNKSFYPNDFLDETYGDKNVYTTPEDLLKFDQALYTDQLINRSLLDLAFTPYSFERKTVHNYGLGWHLMLMPNGKKVIYHSGRWHGFNAAFARLTDEKATIIIMGNKFTWNIYNTAYRCYDIFGNYGQNYNVIDEEDQPELPERKVQPEKKKSKSHS